MKRLYKLLIYCILALFGLACTKQKTLSDEELAIIFHDAFLANAYTLNEGIKLDSLRLYEPIFQKYGYTTSDVQYTIGNFALRKSSRLSDVVERAISLLEERGKELDLEVAILDTIDKISVKRTTKTIREDSLFAFRRLKDSSKMRIVLDDLLPGKYDISFSYLIDSLDNTKNIYKTFVWRENKGDSVQYSKSSNLLNRFKDGSLKSSIDADSLTQRIVIQLVDIEKPSVTSSRFASRKRSDEKTDQKIDKKTEEKKKELIKVDISDLKIEYIPQKEYARKLLFKESVNLNIFDNELLFAPKDSL